MSFKESIFQQRSSPMLSNNIVHEVNPNSTSYISVTGVDSTIIKTYPKTLAGAANSTHRLLKYNYNVCPICLSKYQPKNTLKALPDCFHYFHSDCLDEWLRLNATCPLCRSSPAPSMGPTPVATPLSESVPLAYHGR